MMLLLNENERCFYITKNRKVILTQIETEILSYLLTHNPAEAYNIAIYVYKDEVLLPQDELNIKRMIYRMNYKYSKVFRIVNKHNAGFSLEFAFKLPALRIKYFKQKIALIQEESKKLKLKRELEKVKNELINTEINIKSIEKKLKI